MVKHASLDRFLVLRLAQLDRSAIERATMKTTLVLALLVLGSAASVGCDEKKNDAPDTGAPMMSAAPSAMMSAMPSATASASAMASSSAAPAPMPAGPSDTAEVSVPDPVKEPAKTALVNVNGTVNLYLPKWAGTTWAVKTADKALPKPKEETIPGFAGPTTPAAKFAWKLDKVKAGSYKVEMTNTNKDDKTAAAKGFTLTVEVK